MCRKSAWCTELPENPRLWDRCAPLTAPDWFAESAFAFRRALVEASRGDLRAAAVELEGTRGPELQDWFIEHAQNTHRFRARRSGVKLPAAAGASRDSVRYPQQVYAQVLERDGWCCRFCGTPVVDKRAQDRLHALVGPELFPLGRTNADRHGVRLALTATMDHVEAHHAGGASTVDNLVAACWCCTYGKGRRSLAELLLDDPRLRPPVRAAEDGATRA